MVIPRIIPILTFIEGKLVKTVKFKKPNYIGDPINAIKLFNELEVDELVFLDIRATKNNTPINFELIKDITSECFMPVAYGGGIRTIEEIEKLFAMGVEKIILNSVAFTKPELIEKAAEKFGSQSILVAIDIKKGIFGKYKIFIEGGTRQVKKDVIECVNFFEKAGVGEIIINSIDNDGMMQGYDLELIKTVTTHATVPVVAVGGAGHLNDFVDAIEIGGASAVGAGSMFVYHGRERGILINYPSREEIENIFKGLNNE